MKNNLGILIGRFQPLHAGHRSIIRQAAKLCKHLLIIVGSANSSRSLKNPWTYNERKSELVKFFQHEQLQNISVIPVNDYKYNDSQWQSDIQTLAQEYKQGYYCNSVSLFGFDKPDNTYLKWFPQFEYVNLKLEFNISATEVREKYLKDNSVLIPKDVQLDYHYFKAEADKFKDYPYPETLSFNCSDSIVECNGYILVITRKHAPGRNHSALPGGFKERNETFYECAIRELKEETNLRVPEKVLKGSLVSFKMFDSPTRAAGIPRCTMAYHFKIEPDANGELPRVRPQDDAMQAEWKTISEVLNELPMHDDHRDIIQEMLGVLPLPAFQNSFIN